MVRWGGRSRVHADAGGWVSLIVQCMRLPPPPLPSNPGSPLDLSLSLLLPCPATLDPRLIRPCPLTAPLPALAAWVRSLRTATLRRSASTAGCSCCRRGCRTTAPGWVQLPSAAAAACVTAHRAATSRPRVLPAASKTGLCCLPPALSTCTLRTNDEVMMSNLAWACAQVRMRWLKERSTMARLEGAAGQLENRGPSGGACRVM